MYFFFPMTGGRDENTRAAWFLALLRCFGSSPFFCTVAAVGAQLATPVRLQPGRYATSSPLDTVAVAEAQLATPVQLQPARNMISPFRTLCGSQGDICPYPSGNGGCSWGGMAPRPSGCCAATAAAGGMRSRRCGAAVMQPMQLLRCRSILCCRGGMLRRRD